VQLNTTLKWTSLSQRIYFDKDDDVEGVYLNEKIQKIVDRDFSDNYELSLSKTFD
jgi:hypothetical protein